MSSGAGSWVQLREGDILLRRRRGFAAVARGACCSVAREYGKQREGERGREILISVY